MGKPEAGGPKIYLSDSLDTPLPELDDVSSQLEVGAINEVQTVALAGSPTGGTFTLTYDGQTTAGIAHNASASDVKAALEALPNIGPGNVHVTGMGPWEVEFTGALGGQALELMTADGTSLTGDGASIDIDIDETTKGDTGINEIQTISFDGEPTGGTFTLTFDGQTSSAIPYDAAAGVVENALEDLASIGEGNVSVTGPPGGPWVVEFIGDLAETDVAAITANASGLTGIDDEEAAVTRATRGGSWTMFPDITDESTVKFVEDAEDVRPIWALWRTEDVVTMLGVEEITLQYSRDSVEDLARSLEFASTEEVPAGAAQVGQSVLRMGTQYQPNKYRQALLVKRTHAGYWRAYHFKKVRVTGTMDVTFNYGLTKLPKTLKVFSAQNEGVADDRDILEIYEMTAPKTA